MTIGSGRGAISLDFHGTVVDCDPWFDLEVRHLVSDYLRWTRARGINGESAATTRYDDADQAYRILRNEIVEHGSELSAESCIERVLDRLGIPVNKDEIRAGVEILMQRALQHVKPVHGAIELVRHLQNAEVPLVVVSSAVYHPFLMWSLDRLGLGDAFVDVISSASCGWYKSTPMIYHHAAAVVNAAPCDIIHIGDSYRFDVVGARRAGMKTVWLKRKETEIDGPQPDLTLLSLHDAAPAILKLFHSRGDEL